MLKYKPFSLPVATSSTISIQLIGQQEEDVRHHFTSTIPAGPPTTVHVQHPNNAIESQARRSLHIPLRLPSGSSSSSGPSTPTTPGTPTSSAKYRYGVLVKPGSPLRRVNSSGPPSPASVFEELKGRLGSPRGSETDQDSVLQSSLDDSHDSRSVTSYSTHSSGGGEHDSACSVEGEVALLERVAVASEGDTAVIVQLQCDNESSLEKSGVTDLLLKVANACLSYYRRSESDKGQMNSTQIEKLVLSDRRPVKEHVDNLSRDLSDNVIITKASSRKITEKVFVGTFVNEPVLSKGNVTVGKSAVIVSLHRLNRIAPAREFSDQLCHHIVSHRPEGLGKPTNPKPERVNRKEKGTAANPRARLLLEQSFLYDPTITVTEAARRSFLEVKDYVLYG